MCQQCTMTTPHFKINMPIGAQMGTSILATYTTWPLGVKMTIASVGILERHLHCTVRRFATFQDVYGGSAFAVPVEWGIVFCEGKECLSMSSIVPKEMVIARQAKELSHLLCRSWHLVILDLVICRMCDTIPKKGEFTEAFLTLTLSFKEKTADFSLAGTSSRSAR